MNICALFDMDGVLIDTEPQYTAFWNKIAKQYDINIKNFENEIKGMTIPHIFSYYFNTLSGKEVEQILLDFRLFEESVLFPDIPGAIDFVKELKLHNIRVGLVTSATELKLGRVCQQKQFDTLFDVIISAKDIQNGKPAPDCFLLGAKRLSSETKNCIVFEDSLAGITAGNAAGMSVVGLATTHTEEILMDKCIIVISDFRQITVNWLKTIISNI